MAEEAWVVFPADERHCRKLSRKKALKEGVCVARAIEALDEPPTETRLPAFWRKFDADLTLREGMWMCHLCIEYRDIPAAVTAIAVGGHMGQEKAQRLQRWTGSEERILAMLTSWTATAELSVDQNTASNQQREPLPKLPSYP